MAAALTLAALVLATTASAHHGEPATEQQVSGLDEPGELGADTTNGTLSTDTEITPVAKDGAAAGWEQIGGSQWRSDGTITDLADDSPTPYDLDFYGVDFLDKSNGFAVGAQCRREDPAQPVPADQVAGCERIPVIYRYREHPTKGLIWEESYRASDGNDSGGFAGAITWLGPDRALAVGGTGSYPRRETELTQEQIQQCQAKVEERERIACELDARLANDLVKGPNRAGMARAWLFESGSWRELTDEEIPAEMGALSAIDVSPRPADCGESVTQECAIAGGLAQLWHFADGEFKPTGGYGLALEGGGAVENASAFRFRVRDIRFAPGPLSQGLTQAMAVTSGCCSAQRASDRASVLRLSGTSWSATLMAGGIAVIPGNPAYPGLPNPAYPGSPECPNTRPLPENTPNTIGLPIGSTLNPIAKQLNDTTQSLLDPICGQLENEVFGPLDEEVEEQLQQIYDEVFGPLDDEIEEQLKQIYDLRDRAEREAGVEREVRLFNPDSYYAVNVYRTAAFAGARVREAAPETDSRVAASAVRTPGGPSSRYVPREPASRFVGISFLCDDEGCASESTLLPRDPSSNHSVPAGGTTLSSLRLHSADGDVRWLSAGPGATPLGDGIFDWAVGVLRSTGRGVAYNTAFGANRANASTYLGKPKSCTDDDELIPNSGIGEGQGNSTTDTKGICGLQGYQKQNASKALYLLPSYSLNAYRVAGEDVAKGDEGTGWAVGDHGAILTRGGGVATAARPPARQGAKSQRESLSGGDAFAERRPPPTSEPGQVPSLAGRPRTQGIESDFHDGQDARAGGRHLVMSRDGAEGWAFPDHLNGGGGAHYDGASWAACDPAGVPNLIPADAACSELANASRVYAVARVPLERDTDPSNDDEFEAVALTDKGVYRYREGRWSRDQDARYQLGPDLSPVTGTDGADIAFTAPDDGWVAIPEPSFPAIIHFDGNRWVRCTIEPVACGDVDGRLLIRYNFCPSLGPVRLATAGERVYLTSIRDASNPPQGPSVDPCNGDRWSPDPYPVILYHDRGGTWRGGVDPDWQSGSDATPEDGYNPTDGGWDPGCAAKVEDPDPTKTRQICQATGNPQDRGQIPGLSVAEDADGSFQGWATGTFGGTHPATADAVMMRLSDGHDVPGEGGDGAVTWRQWLVPDAANDYLRILGGVSPDLQLTLPSEAARRNAFLSGSGSISTTVGGTGDIGHSPTLAFDQERGRWEAIPTPWSVSPPNNHMVYTAGAVQAIAPDGQGGFWTRVSSYFYHYTDHAPRPVFEDTPDPADGKQITALDTGADGTVWLGDENGSVYRYDRLTGWSGSVPIPAWDPDRATRRAAVSAVAVGPGGEGIAVGAGGRIANLGDGVSLDPAATIACDPQSVVPPCGTGNDLLTAAVAPDGSAIVAGANRTLLWRPANGDFRPIAEPQVPLATTIEKVVMPRSDRAYLLDENSRVIRGEMTTPGTWSWTFELGDPDGKPDPLIASGNGGGSKVADIAVDSTGHGYAVGSAGLLLERTGDGSRPWRRIPVGYANNLQVVVLPAGGGAGALIGGEDGLILTLTSRGFEVARHADPYDPRVAGGTIGARMASTVAGLTLAPGYGAGDVEAWALLKAHPLAVRQAPPNALLHHSTDGSGPALNPARALTALPDAPAPVPGEISFAAFGKQDCDGANRSQQRGSGSFATRDTCGPPDGANTTSDLISRRIGQELSERLAGNAGPQFAVFTGDAVDTSGGRETVSGGPFPVTDDRHRTPLDIDLKHRRWVELIAHWFEDQGLPLVAAIGGQDLSRNVEWCSPAVGYGTFGGCGALGQAGAEQLGVQPGLNLPWRAAMAFTDAPWEGDQQGNGIRFERVGGAAFSTRGPNEDTPSARPPAPADLDPQLNRLAEQNALRGPRARAESYRLDAGDTHYAVDVIDEERGEKLARIVVVDTSMRSLAASDPQQHPIEPGGQLRWLEEVLCFEGSPEDTNGDIRDCTREEGQQAIVVSNTPTYSYGPISPEELQTDAAVFESVLLKNRVNVVVSGRVGWNGRYWALAPGVHAPCPGEHYRPDSEAPSIGQAEVCGAGAGEALDPGKATGQLPEEAREVAGLTERGALPFVVSSTAGGRFNVRAERGGFATAENGFWRGYSIVRLHPSGDPRKAIVEQRPILDWVGLAASDPVVEPRRTLKLESFAREAFGMDTSPRYYPIDFEGITHRYDLLLADPDEPAAACVASDAGCVAYYSKLAEGSRSFDFAAASGSGSAQDDKCSPYLCLPERVGTIDALTGEVKGGNGKYPDTFALAMLSVGDHVAAQPLVFTRSPSFIVNPAIGFPEIPGTPAETGTGAAPPPPPPPPTPNVPQVNTPAPPLPPPIVPLQAAQPPEPQPPAPPAPPPPSEAPAPISLTLAPPSITVATPTAVIQPPTPPVNPAPPGGARREARQRQAAAQKSGADPAEGSPEDRAGETQGAGGDMATRPMGADMTRRDTAAQRSAATRRERSRPGPSFTPLARPEQPSASARGLLYAGGLGIAAAALALGFSGVRPTPRRRPPEVPAPASAQTYRRR